MLARPIDAHTPSTQPDGKDNSSALIEVPSIKPGVPFLDNSLPHVPPDDVHAQQPAKRSVVKRPQTVLCNPRWNIQTKPEEDSDASVEQTAFMRALRQNIESLGGCANVVRMGLGRRNRYNPGHVFNDTVSSNNKSRMERTKSDYFHHDSGVLGFSISEDGTPLIADHQKKGMVRHAGAR